MRKELIRKTFKDEIIPLKIYSLAKLVKTLREYHIPLEIWGKRLALTPQDLLDEILAEKCQLVAWEGRLVRLLSIATVFVYYPLNKSIWEHLLETKRVLRSGLHKNYSTIRGIGKKIRQDESPARAAGRAFTEDLGLSQIPDLYQISFAGRRNFHSRSYPRIISGYNEHIFGAFAPKKLMRNRRSEYSHTNKSGIETILEWKPLSIGDVNPVMLEAAGLL